MLAKQAWRLVQIPSSLVAQVLASKYYNSGNFLNAQLGSNPSYLWRSLLLVRPIPMKGLCWRVGNGKDIKIWSNRWLPLTPNFQVQTRSSTPPEDAPVLALIDESICKWKDHLVGQIFHQEEAEMILRIPVSQCGSGDKQIWSFTRNGHFIVKSVYHMQVEIEELRKACHEGLPTKLNLYRKKVVDNPMCPICDLSKETTERVLWSYVAARDVWFYSSKRLQKAKIENQNFKELMFNLFDTFEEKELLQIVVVVWKLWKRRNAMIFENIFSPPLVLFNQAIQRLSEIHASFQSQQIRISIPTSSSSCCMRPPQGIVKINWDASVDKHLYLAGFVVVVRDSEGHVLATMRIKQNLLLDPHLAESYASKFAMELGYQQIILEGDALNVVEGIKIGAQGWDSSSMLILDARSLLNQLQQWTIAHIHKSFNSVAHVLGRSALSIANSVFDIEEVPQ
ncbi:hypothetical protein F2P56_026891, partial [Juglans regia]